MLEGRTEKTPKKHSFHIRQQSHGNIILFSYNLSSHLKDWHSCSQEMNPCEIKKGPLSNPDAEKQFALK